MGRFVPNNSVCAVTMCRRDMCHRTVLCGTKPACSAQDHALHPSPFSHLVLPQTDSREPPQASIPDLLNAPRPVHGSEGLAWLGPWMQSRRRLTCFAYRPRWL